jgi:hypothetical protein
VSTSEQTCSGTATEGSLACHTIQAYKELCPAVLHFLLLTRGPMSSAEARDAKGDEESQKEQRSVHRVRLPGFVSEEDVGLGDLVMRATSAMHVKPCGGCKSRAQALNRWLSFHR